MTIKLSDQQAGGLDKVINWYENRQFHTIPGSAFGADVFTWFGYAGTGKTKAQGSEAEKVYVVNETPGMIAMTAKREGERAALEQARRWIYTAVTRAREQVIITRPQ